MLHCETFGTYFLVVHLSPEDYDHRIKESKVILSRIASVSNDFYMVLGDFNAQSPFDRDRDYQVALENIRMGDFKNSKYNSLLDNEFEYSVMASFIANPIIDVMQRFVKPEERFTFPIKLWSEPCLSDKDERRLIL